MTDDKTTPVPKDIWRSYEEKEGAFKALSASLHTANKRIVFDALQAAGITRVLVQFDGSGDSGQIEDIGAVSGDEPRDFPAGKVVIGCPTWGASEVRYEDCSVRDAVETLAYGFLEETHSGWEINEGAYGEFTFDVADRSITLDYNERIETSEYTQHLF